MSFTVRIRQFDIEIDVGRGQTILEAALDEDLDFPFYCRGGTCGNCKSVLISGRIDMKAYAGFALSPDEKARGQILACRAMPLTDCEIAYLDPDEPATAPFRELEGAIASIERVTHDIAAIRVATPGDPLDFAAGQFASVTFGDLPPRDYSLANAPRDSVLEFHVRVSATGNVSRRIYETAAVGDRVRVKGPFGAAYLRKLHKGSLFLAAGGSGLAPIRSILLDALRAGLSQPIHLHFGVRAERDLYGLGELRALAAAHPNLRVVPVLSAPDGPTGHRTGLLADVLAADLGPDAAMGAKAYLCGPPAMVETCRAVLMERGLAPQDCHSDAFYTQAELDALAAG